MSLDQAQTFEWLRSEKERLEQRNKILETETRAYAQEVGGLIAELAALRRELEKSDERNDSHLERMWSAERKLEAAELRLQQLTKAVRDLCDHEASGSIVHNIGTPKSWSDAFWQLCEANDKAESALPSAPEKRK